jgi:hypothetical protein
VLRLLDRLSTLDIADIVTQLRALPCVTEVVRPPF